MLDLTIFVITSGIDPNFDACMKALDRQNFKDFKTVIIKDVAPMSAAFQKMIDLCTTSYYIQLDSDMILSSDAVGIMYRAIREAGHRTAFVAFKLQDVHLQRWIYGVKIYKHGIMRKYPYNLDVISCEMEQADRMKKDGYSYACFEEILGEHSPNWTVEGIFERYRDLMAKYALGRAYTWEETLPRRLIEAATTSPTMENLAAVLGAFSTIFGWNSVRDEEKNFCKKSEEWIRFRGWSSYVYQATLYVTDKCNQACPFCLRQRGQGPSLAPDVDVSTTRLLLERFPKLQGICLCGFGEPLMSPNIKWIIKYIQEVRPDITVSVITNGLLLGERLSEFDDARPNFWSVSLNAANSDEHEEQTGTVGGFEKICQGILAARSRGYDVFLSFVLNRKNLRRIQHYIRVSETLGVTGVYLHNVLPHGVHDKESEKRFLREVLTVSDEEYIERMKTLPGAGIVRKWPTLVNPAAPKRNCSFPFGSIAVDGDGNISICNSIYPPRPENGNIRDDLVWQGEYARRWREQYAKKEIDPACKWCFRNWEE